MGYWFDYYKERLTREFPRKLYNRTLQNSVFGAIIGSIANMFTILEETDTPELENSISPLTAEGFWLDFWGFFLGETRYTQESDSDYRTRILNGINYGKNTELAIIQSIEFLTATTPEIIEDRGKILENFDYATDFDYDAMYEGQAFTFILKYRTRTTSIKAAYVGISCIGQSAYIYRPFGVRPSNLEQNRIVDIVNRTKLAGTKVIHDIS